MGELECTIFEIAWDLRGFDRLLLDFAENNPIAAALIEKITDIRVFQALKLIRSGVDILRLGDDVGMQTGMIISVEMWRKWLKPGLKKVIEKSKSINEDVLIFYHSDGSIEPIIPELIDIGIDILNPVQPECMDPVKLKKEYGSSLSFWGTIGTQRLMPFGSSENVKDEIKRMKETVGKGGGLLLAPTHILEPEVPWKNILAFFEAADLYGNY
jgi:uroporphyrinogen decarboxylase